MSSKQPCVYCDDSGKCEKFSVNGIESWCALPDYCKSKTPSNADHIRSMTDEELRVVLEILAKSDVCLNSQSAQCDGCVFSPFCNSVRCAEDVMDWLKQPYKEEAEC